MGDGTGAGAVVAGRVGTGFGDFPVGTGVGVAVPGLPGTGLATGAGDLTGAGAVGTADGVAPRGTGAAVAGAEAGGLGVGAVVGSADGAVGAAVAVAAAAVAPCVSWVAGAPAECDEAAALPDAGAPPEQPVSASPAATPSAAPNVARGVFESDRICLLLDVIPTMNSADDDLSTGKYGVTGEKLCRKGSNLSPCSPVYAQAGSPCGRRT